MKRLHTLKSTSNVGLHHEMRVLAPGTSIQPAMFHKSCEVLARGQGADIEELLDLSRGNFARGQKADEEGSEIRLSAGRII